MIRSRLEKTLYRLTAQHACFAAAFAELAGRPGVVFEIGLGLGRSYHHMCCHLPEHRFVVFERVLNCYDDCRPPDEQLIMGDVAETLPAAADEHAGQVVLAHSDIGSFDRAMNARLAVIVSAGLAPALAPGALVMSDLPLSIPQAEELDVPGDAPPGSYYLYRYQPK